MIGHLELWTGLAGDMWVGALLDAGWPEEALQSMVRRLGLSGLRVRVERRSHRGLTGLGIAVESGESSPHRGLSEISRILEAAELSQAVRARALAVFRRLAEVEARVHGCGVDEIHFHEVGALDAIVDIVAVVEGLETLNVSELTCSPIPIHPGRIEMAHGRLPTPAPATALLLEGWPVRAADGEGEFITPTAAALLSVLARPAPALPSLDLVRLGHGAGTRAHPTLPNLVRFWYGTAVAAAAESGESAAEGLRVRAVSVLETQIDDMTAEDLAALAEELRGCGALDVLLEPTLMKKGRPGTRLVVVARPETEAELARRILGGSSTLGVRIRREQRWEVSRRVERVQTPWGAVTLKWADTPHGLRCKPEADDLISIARDQGVALSEVRTRIASWMARHVAPPAGS